MQGLAHYADDSPSPPASSRRRDPSREAGPSRQRNNGSASSRPRSKAKGKERQAETHPDIVAGDLPENLTHTAQLDLDVSELADEPGGGLPKATFEGLSEEEIFRRVTRPPDIVGAEDWGIPSPVDPAECSPGLQAKVENFLRLKYEKGQHINSTLLGSSAFANPHIYAKLVEFVDIDERASAFPAGGWLTRAGLEDSIPLYGPTALSAQQKAKEDAVKRSQETGKRSSINFQSARHRDEPQKREGDRAWDKGRGIGSHNGSKNGALGKRDREYDRERERERDRDGHRRSGYDRDRRY